MKQFDQLADISVVEKTIAALKRNSMDAVFAQTGSEAKEKAYCFFQKAQKL